MTTVTLWYALPLIVSVSLVCAATRYELMHRSCSTPCGLGRGWRRLWRCLWGCWRCWGGWREGKRKRGRFRGIAARCMIES